MRKQMTWAEKEMRIAGWFDGDMQEGMARHVLDLLKVFTDEGHSGSSAPYAVRSFERLATWKPLSPLTGEDDEWNETGPGRFQNNRFSEVFKDEDGQTYWAFGKVFVETWLDEHGKAHRATYTSAGSRVPIESFPWAVPDRPEFVEVTPTGED